MSVPSARSTRPAATATAEPLEEPPGSRPGARGLPGGSSLARLLEEHCGKRKRPPALLLTVKQILAWADAYHERTGRWPNRSSGPVADTPGENWRAIDTALRRGHRNLPGDSSLSWFLAENDRED